MNHKGQTVLIAYFILLCSVILPTTCWKGAKDPRDDPSVYTIGLGIYDITGPAEGVNMMGYANPAQVSRGIHIRLYARTFIIADDLSRFVFVSADCGMAGQAVKMKVVELLQLKYGSLYTFENVVISGTHTHSGPAGFLQYLLFDITSLGFIPETYSAMVEGIYESIKMAHNSMIPGKVKVSSGELVNASINRSPSAYLNNPEDEQELYGHNIDTIMTVLRFEDTSGNPIGMFNWFAVHPTSMNNTNPYISGDNKGYASQLFEKAMNPSGTLPGEGKFVAAFAQANCGDISPNILGAKCIDTGLECDILTSTCGDGRVQKCIASGPGKDMTESTKIIGERQFNKAYELFHSDEQTTLSGPVGYIHQFIDMAEYKVTLANGTEARTCKAALGYSFAAGTTDGPGAFDFTQGMTDENPFWNGVVDFIKPTLPEQEICHHPKPVLLDTGNYNEPYPWHPQIIETQVATIGQFIIAAVPGEFTTMAGRRLKNKMKEVAETEGLSEDAIAVIGGLSNTYSHYITTIEEYAVQRYEGASTIFGPFTLDAYLQQYSFLLEALAKNEKIPEGTPPPDLSNDQVTLLPDVVFDHSPNGYNTFGNVIAEPYPLAYVGETIIAKFISGNPRNSVRLNNTFLTVERKDEEDKWEIIATDANWETRFSWERISSILGTSEATIYWEIPEGTKEGTYRIRHFGDRKSIINGNIREYEGLTKEFKVELPPPDRKKPIRRDFQKETREKESEDLLQWISNLFGF